MTKANPDKQPDATAETAADAVTPAQKSGFEAITLAMPIQRGETKIEKLTIRKPKAGELRGLAMPDIIGMEVSTILKLIPRVSDPVLTVDECDDLDVSDLTEISGTLRGFFMTASETMMLDTMIAEQQPKTS